MSAGLRVNNIAPVGERPSDIIRGRTGVAVAGVGTIVGSQITGTPSAQGDIIYYDVASDTWQIGGYASAFGVTGFLLVNEGGQDEIDPHGSMGSTETFDPTDGNVQTGTLDAACTITLAAPTGSGACTLELVLTQDGTGGWAVTWPGSVSWIGGTPSPDTSPGAVAYYLLESLDGGSSWTGVMLGSGGGSISVTDGSTTVNPATSIDFTSGATVTNGGGGVAQVAVSGGGTTYSGCKGTRSSTSFGTGSFVAVDFDGEDWDTDTYHSTSSNTSRFTAPATAKYRIAFTIEHSVSGWYAYLRVNGSGVAWSYAFAGGTGSAFVANAATSLALTSGDYVEVLINAASGTINNDGNTSLVIERLPGA